MKSWKGKDKLSKRACTAAHTCSLTLPRRVPWAFPHSIKRIADSGGSHIAEWQMFKLPLALCPLGWRGWWGFAPNLPFPPPLPVPSPTPCLIWTLWFIFHKYNRMRINVHGEKRQSLEIPGGCCWGRNTFKKVNLEDFCLCHTPDHGHKAEGGAGGCASLLHPPSGANYLQLRGVKHSC